MNKQSLYVFIYNSGDAFLPDKIKYILGIDIIGSSKKTFYISGWSLVHFLNGIIAGYLYIYLKYNIRVYTLNLFILHTIWELWQILIGMAKPYKLTGRSNIIDTMVDTILFMAGTYIIRKL